MDKFSKMLVGISVIFTSIYFVLIAILALVYGENYFNDTYIVLIEGTLCAVCSSQDKFHCKNLRYTCYGIFIFDGSTRLDNIIDFIPLGIWYFIPILILVASMLTSIVLSIRHFIKVRRIKKQKKNYGSEK